LANTAGWRNVVGDTRDPIRTRLVTAATAAIVDQHSDTSPDCTVSSGEFGMK